MIGETEIGRKEGLRVREERNRGNGWNTGGTHDCIHPYYVLSLKRKKKTDGHIKEIEE